MELAACHPSGAQNFEKVRRFFDNLWIHGYSVWSYITEHMRIISKLQKSVLKRSDQTLPLYNDVQRVTHFIDKHMLWQWMF